MTNDFTSLPEQAKRLAQPADMRALPASAKPAEK